MRTSLLQVLAVLLALNGPALAEAGSDLEVPSRDEPANLLAEIRAATLDEAHPLEVSELRLNTGFAVIDLRSGILVPVRTARGRAVEMVFRGDGEIRYDPPDAVEAGQLELFTNQTTLRESFAEAVFVVARDQAAAALTGRPAATEVAPAVLGHARETLEAWKASPERRTLGVELGILLDALGAPLHEAYFAGWFQGRTLGRFFLQMNPAAEEQINLGQFVSFGATDEERRRISGFLHRQQKRGQLVGLEIADLGRWDSWISTPLRDSEGRPRPGTRAFEPVHYALETTLDPSSGEVFTRSRIHLQTVASGRRVVSLSLHRDLAIERLRAQAGDDLFLLREGDDVHVFLPEIAEAGDEVVLEVDARGPFLEPGGDDNWSIRDTLGWYPRSGPTERATYDVTLRWPEHLDLVATGKIVESGKDGTRRWQRRKLEVPALGFTFSIGRFEIKTASVHGVDITVAFDPSVAAAMPETSLDELTATVADSLRYFEEIFGDYPLDELTVVTVPRQFSQAMLGFVTLSSPMMVNWGIFGSLLGVQDRESVVAHEIAHQWWGHLVGWRSYRDQWISEAMANYAAIAWARNRGRKTSVGPVTGWEEELTTTLADGRPLESIGPLVLGERLFSTRSQDTYHAIVYRKGALVLHMLAQRLGQDVFLEAAKRVVAAARGRVISTEEFLSLLEDITGSELDGFARQFVYGTGLPQVYYDYSFAKTPDKRWQVRVIARQETSYRYRYAIVPGADGRPTVERRRVEQVDVDRSELVVPFQILVPQEERTSRGRATPAALSPPASAWSQPVINGTMLLSGSFTEHVFEIDHPPLKLWIDHRQEVLARFFDQRRHPKRLFLNQALKQAAAGNLARAEESLEHALRARSPIASTDGLLDVHLELELVRVLLGGRRLHEASDRLQSAKQLFESHDDGLPRAEGRRFRTAFNLLEARIDIERGHYESAYRRLTRQPLDPRDATSTEGYLLLAIAARATGHGTEADEALRLARERGADISWFVGG